MYFLVPMDDICLAFSTAIFGTDGPNLGVPSEHTFAKNLNLLKNEPITVIHIYEYLSHKPEINCRSDRDRIGFYAKIQITVGISALHAVCPRFLTV